jgi:SAM-dependent methyltransferase
MPGSRADALRRRLYDLAVAQAEHRRWVRRAGEVLSPRQREQRRVRKQLADRFLKGEGLEIGALHLPLQLPKHAHARYVDRYSRDDLRTEYPELRTYDLVEVDVVDDGEQLTTVPSGSADFLIANHFIEHPEDPIATLQHHARVIKPGGVLFMAVPDKRSTFDVDRPVTPLSHLISDHEHGPSASRREHYEEWVRLVEKKPADEIERRARELDEAAFSIHFHVFTPATFADLLHHAHHEAGIPLRPEAIVPAAHEFVTVLRRCP